MSVDIAENTLCGGDIILEFISVFSFEYGIYLECSSITSNPRGTEIQKSEIRSKRRRTGGQVFVYGCSFFLFKNLFYDAAQSRLLRVHT